MPRRSASPPMPRRSASTELGVVALNVGMIVRPRNFDVQIQVITSPNVLRVRHAPNSCERGGRSTYCIVKLEWKISKETSDKKIEDLLPLKPGDTTECALLLDGDGRTCLRITGWCQIWPCDRRASAEFGRCGRYVCRAHRTPAKCEGCWRYHGPWCPQCDEDEPSFRDCEDHSGAAFTDGNGVPRPLCSPTTVTRRSSARSAEERSAKCPLRRPTIRTGPLNLR